MNDVFKTDSGPDANCPKCEGKGHYMHDHNHSTICDACCTHDKGWWLLEKHYGENNGKLCCQNGCGTIKENK